MKDEMKNKMEINRHFLNCLSGQIGRKSKSKSKSKSPDLCEGV